MLGLRAWGFLAVPRRIKRIRPRVKISHNTFRKGSHQNVRVPHPLRYKGACLTRAWYTARKSRVTFRRFAGLPIETAETNK